MGKGRIAIVAVLGLVVLVAATVVSTATNTVPSTNLGESGQPIVANDFRPPECAALNLTAVVTTAPELVVRTAAGEFILASGGNDCVLAGAGDDRVFAGASAGDDVALGQDGGDWLFGGAGTDTCHGGPGTERFFNCETQIP